MRLFISYSRVDRVFTDRFIARIHRMFPGNVIWYDEELYGGDNWWDEILNQIEACDIFIYLLSNESVTSDYCKAEFSEARRLQKRIITVQVRDRTNLPPELGDIQYVDMKRGVDDADAVTNMARALHYQQEKLPKRALKALWQPRTARPSTHDEVRVNPNEDIVTPDLPSAKDERPTDLSNRQPNIGKIVGIIGIMAAAIVILILIVPNFLRNDNAQAQQTATAVALIAKTDTQNITATQIQTLALTATGTYTPVPPTPTLIPTAADTLTPVPPTPTPTATYTPVPPTSTSTSTATRTYTPIPPTRTLRPTASSTPTHVPSSTPVTIKSQTPEIAVLLPDSVSPHWENDDRRFLSAAFDAAGVNYVIVNAEGVAAQQIALAEQAIASGVKVIMLVNLDSISGAAIIAKAHNAGVKVIDYDRLTIQGKGADFYVSFGYEAAGRLEGEGLIKAVAEAGLKNPHVAVLNGSPTDNNATLFANGYNSVIKPLFNGKEWTLVDDQSVPSWDNTQAQAIFEQMLRAAGGKIDAAIAANDGLANAVIMALQNQGLPYIPVTGQDASVIGIQNILAGRQSMTVYKANKQEAEAAAALAIALVKGEDTSSMVTSKVNNGTKDIPAVLLIPLSVTKDNIKETVIADGYRTWAEICVGEFAQYCPKS